MMKKRIHILSVLLLVVFGQIALYAQSDSIIDVSIKERVSEVKGMKLPPLSTFFENIHEHPSVGIYETYKDEALAELGEEKQKWLDYLRLFANYQYGKNYSFSENIDQTAAEMFSSDKATNIYGVGLSISIPIGDVTSRNKRIKAKKASLKRVQYEYDMAVEERKFMILEAYNTAVELLATLSVKSDAAALYDAQMSIVEEDFKMGKIDIIQLSQERSRHADAIVSYEKGKVSLHNTITLLEMLSNVKIINN